MLEEISKFFNEAEKHLTKCSLNNWDIYVAKQQSRSISYRQSAIEDFEENIDLGWAIRILKDSRISMIYGNSFSDVEKNIEKAEFMLRYMTENPHFKMNKELNIPADNKLLDMSINARSIAVKVDSLAQLESMIYKEQSSIKQIESLSFSESFSQGYYRTAYSDILTEEAVHYGYSAEAIAEDNSGQEAGSWYSYKTRLDELNILDIAQKTAYNAYSMLGSKPVSSGHYTVIMNNDVFAHFLATFADLFSADKVQNKKSVLRDKLGEQIASSIFKLTDDPTLAGELGSMSFDGEGTATAVTKLIDAGALSGYLYDLKTASKDGVASTGNALRSSYQGSPLITPTNLVVGKGSSTFDKMINIDEENYLVINNVMGMHTANSVNGDFSVGATGYLYSRGKCIKPVKQITIAGNFLTMLTDIMDIADNSENFPLHGNIITPAIKIKKLMVSG